VPRKAMGLLNEKYGAGVDAGSCVIERVSMRG